MIVTLKVDGPKTARSAINFDLFRYSKCFCSVITKWSSFIKVSASNLWQFSSWKVYQFFCMHRNFECSQTAKRSFFSNEITSKIEHNLSHFFRFVFSNKTLIGTSTFEQLLHLEKKLLSPRKKLSLLRKTGKPVRNTSIWSFRWFTFLRTYRLDAFSQNFTQVPKCFEAGCDRSLCGFDHCYKVLTVRGINEVLAKMIWLGIPTHSLPLLQASYHAARSTLNANSTLVKDGSIGKTTRWFLH